MGDKEEKLARKLEAIRKKRIKVQGIASLRSKLAKEKALVKKAERGTLKGRFGQFISDTENRAFKSLSGSVKRAVRNSTRKRKGKRRSKGFSLTL